MALSRSGPKPKYGERNKYPPSYNHQLRSDMPETDGSEYTADEVEFMMAMDRYKREKGKPFPNWAEVLEVAKALGYRKFL